MPNVKYEQLPHIITRDDAAYMIQRDCDCACSTVPLAPSGLLSSLENQAFHVPAGLHTFPLTPDYHLAYLPSGNGKGDGIAVVNSTALEMLLALHHKSSSPSPLSVWTQRWGTDIVDTAIHDFLQLGFVSADIPHASERCQSETSPVANDTLAVWLHLTDRCNLRCSYCYLPHRAADMSFETGKAALKAAFRSATMHEFRQVKIKYAGGEPLLQFPLVLELQAYARQLAQYHEIELDAIVLSNGTLLSPDMLDNLKAHDLRLMISLDHLPPNENDTCSAASQRCYPDGRSTAPDALRNVELALAHNVLPDISITVSARNIRAMPELITWTLERRLPFGLNFYREHDCCASCHDLRMEDDVLIEGMRSVYQVIEEHLPRRSLLASLVDRANLAIPHAYTCGVGRHYLVIDPEGKVSKCQMHMTQPITTSHADDPLGEIARSQIGIQNLPVDQKHECRACEWKYWCAGGCPFAAYRATGRYDAKSPYCEVYKALYPEVLRLEGLRLLKYAQ